MRYDTAIVFRRHTQGDYDPNTGDYGEPKVDVYKRFCSVCDTSDEVMTFVYGGIKQGSVTLHLQTAYLEPFDDVRIGDKTYRVDHRRRLRHKQVLVLSEVL